MSAKNALPSVFLLTTLLAVCMFGSAFAFSSDSWVPKASMNHTRAYLGVAVVNDKIYAIGGDEGSETGNCMTGTSMTNNAVNYTEEYDTELNVWTEKAAMPTARAHFGTAVYQNKIYCIGGYNGATVFIGPENWNWKTEYYDVGANEVYDPTANTWTTMASLPTPRFAAATNIVDGIIYAIGGHTMTNLYETYNITEAYDPQSNSWTTRSQAPLPVSTSASAVIDNKIYVLGQNPNASWQNTLEVYDPETDSWTIGDKAPVSHSATAVATSGVNAPKSIYFFAENTTDIYNPVTNSWVTGTPAPTDRLIAKAAVVEDTIYLIGGRTGQWGYMTFMYPSALNEQYLPIGYGTPSSSTLTPTEAPEPTPTVPEISWLAIVPLFLSVFSVTVVLRHRKTAKSMTF